MGVNRTISQVRSKALTFLYKEIKAGCKMRQLYKFLLCVVSESMLLVPVTSEKNAENIVYFLQQSCKCLLRGSKKTGKKITCSESPHLRKAENDCNRAQMYWPPTVATQYQSFCATVSPGPSKPVLTVSKNISDWDELCK